MEEDVKYCLQAWTKTPIGKIDGQRQWRSDELTEASAGAVRQLSPEVSSAAGSVGTGADEWHKRFPDRILSPDWIVNLRVTNGAT
jgi:hypothetical protein